jgi:CarD family transcriptional regulator
VPDIVRIATIKPSNRATLGRTTATSVASAARAGKAAPAAGRATKPKVSAAAPAPKKTASAKAAMPARVVKPAPPPKAPPAPPPPAEKARAVPKMPPPVKSAPMIEVEAPKVVVEARPEPVADPATLAPAQAVVDLVVFKVGDKAVYPRGGVAEVIGIEELDIAGNRQRFYVLRLLQNNSKIRVPVGNANAVGLRQLISEQEIQEVFDILRERTIAFDKQTWNRRYRGFMDKIKTGSIYDVAEVLRDLYRLKTDKQLSFGEKRMLDEARSLIVKEIAIARGQTEDDVKNEIEAIFLSN